MKTVNRFILFLIVSCFFIALLLIAFNAKAGQNPNSDTLVILLDQAGIVTPAWWEKNWSFVALAVSEVAAFLPSKASGIVQALAQSIVRLSRAFFGIK